MDLGQNMHRFAHYYWCEQADSVGIDHAIVHRSWLRSLAPLAMPFPGVHQSTTEFAGANQASAL